MALLAFAFALITLFLEPLVALHIYNWYVFPVTEYALTYWLFFGILLLIGVFRGITVADYTAYEKHLKNDAEVRAQRSFVNLFSILLTWGVAFLFHLIIT